MPSARLVALALAFAVTALAGGGPATGQPTLSAGNCQIARSSKCPRADLRGVDLKGQLMTMMVLTGADLAGANLQAANLWKADLAAANLSGASLAEAFLTGANLRGAKLVGTDLRKAFLFGSFTEGADFTGAQLDGARWITGAVCGPRSVGECRPLPPDAPVEAPMQNGPPGGTYPGNGSPR